MLIVLATSPRVAPGLLSWDAWQALRSAAAVLAPAGHPQLPALDGAGVSYQLTEGEPSGAGLDGAGLASTGLASTGLASTGLASTGLASTGLASTGLDGTGTVVWLPEPGDDPPVPPGARLLRGSADLPGAHLLDLVATMDRLRRNCPWDARQTHESLAPYLLEEPYEALDALESGDQEAFREELGDVLLQVAFHARLAAEREDGTGYTIDDVADGIVAKLVRRHPHVFADLAVSGADEVTRNWDEIKKEEKKLKAERAGRSAVPEVPSALDGVPFGQPALSLAAQLQRRAGRAGVPGSLTDLPGEEIGAELFRLVAKARAAGLDPETELRAAARRFGDRVRAWERS